MQMSKLSIVCLSEELHTSRPKSIIAINNSQSKLNGLYCTCMVAGSSPSNKPSWTSERRDSIVMNVKLVFANRNVITFNYHKGDIMEKRNGLNWLLIISGFAISVRPDKWWYVCSNDRQIVHCCFADLPSTSTPSGKDYPTAVLRYE